MARPRWLLLACFCSLTSARRDDDIVEAKSSDAARETGDDDRALDRCTGYVFDRWQASKQHRNLLRAGRRRRRLQPAAQEPARARDLLVRAPGAQAGWQDNNAHLLALGNNLVPPVRALLDLSATQFDAAGLSETRGGCGWRVGVALRPSWKWFNSFRHRVQDLQIPLNEPPLRSLRVVANRIRCCTAAEILVDATLRPSSVHPLQRSEDCSRCRPTSAPTSHDPNQGRVQGPL